MQISSLFKDICERFDVFNQKTFDALAIISRKNCEEYAIQRKRHDLTVNGNHLWKEKEYEQLLLLYQQNSDILTKLERKRCEYIQRQLDKS